MHYWIKRNSLLIFGNHCSLITSVSEFRTNYGSFTDKLLSNIFFTDNDFENIIKEITNLYVLFLGLPQIRVFPSILEKDQSCVSSWKNDKQPIKK